MLTISICAFCVALAYPACYVTMFAAKLWRDENIVPSLAGNELISRQED
ncbi:hypothetical protein [Methylomarinum vadi]|nr:hypothetical protein [Methylomarinum vadi]